MEPPNQHQQQHRLQYPPTTPLSRKQRKGQNNPRYPSRQTQQDWDPRMSSVNPPNFYGNQRNTTGYHQQQHRYDRHSNQQQNPFQRFDNHNHHQPWTSTPRDQNSRYHAQGSHSMFGENTTNNSLLNILDTQCKVQQETTQAL